MPQLPSRRALAAAALAALSSGCLIHVHESHTGPRERARGSGRVVSEVRTVAPFHALEAEGALRLELTVGAPASLTVTWDDDLLGCVSTQVRDGVLRVEQDCDASSGAVLRVVATTPGLRRLALSGAVDAELRGVAGPELALEVDGATRLSAAGRVERLEVEAAGSSDLDLAALAARGARVEAAGSTTLALDVAEALEVDAEGSADIRYRGRPRLGVRQSGAVRVRALD